jgi:hypothetical protein
MDTDLSVRQQVKTSVRQRDDYKCVVCGSTEVQVHHVEFLSRGGRDSPSNCVCLCEQHHTDIHEGNLSIETFEADENEIYDMEATEADISRAIWRLDEQEKEEKGEMAHKIHRTIANCKDKINEELARMGFALCKFKENKLWDVLGYRSMREWCQDPDIDLRYDKAQRLIRVTKRHVIQAGRDPQEIAEMGIYKADRVSQFHDAEDYDELVAIATGASRVDLDEEIKQRKDNGEESDEPTNDTPEWIDTLDSYVKRLKDDPDDKETMQQVINLVNKQWKNMLEK